ncbi:MAG: hypothetical protein NVS2B16_11850 [Chloroflexota bacterium]
MLNPSMENATADGPAWAQRFAKRRQALHEPQIDVNADNARWVTETVGILWSMFDEALRETTTALEQYEATDYITARRTDSDYRLSMSDSYGAQQHISIFASLCMRDGHASGGAGITVSGTRATIWLTPSTNHAHLGWIVRSTGVQFTAKAVDDLFLSVFSDDPAATMRLSNHFTID